MVTKDKFKPWQRWVLFALAMAVIFASGVIISFLMEHSAEVVNVDYKKKIKNSCLLMMMESLNHFLI